MALSIRIECNNCGYSCPSLPIPRSFARSLLRDQNFATGAKILDGDVTMYVCRMDNCLTFAEMQNTRILKTLVRKSAFRKR